MAATAVITGHDTSKGAGKPFGISYGKMMMWFFILSDALTFSAFIISYGFSRYKFIEEWPIADEVFTHFPFLHGTHAPMYYVALMTFILIFSSVTMVLAVDAGHKMDKKKVAFYMFLTIIGGGIFVGSQAWEWKNFIKGEFGAVTTKSGSILQFVDESGHQIALSDFVTASHQERVQHESSEGLWFVSEKALPVYTMTDIQKSFASHPEVRVRTQQLTETGQKTILDHAQSTVALQKGIKMVSGANLVENEYGHRLFADFFFFITGFHGFHVFSGVIFNLIIFINVVLGTYEKRGHYEMVEKVGLYWHFVDLVWVFVFTFFYLV